MIFIFLFLIPIKVVRVIDGDTFKGIIDTDTFYIRLIGVDCPESKKNIKTCKDAKESNIDIKTIINMGKLAKRFTEKYIKEDSIILLEYDVQKRDKYGRILGYIWLNDTLMFNDFLIKEGYAQLMTFPPNLKYHKKFLKSLKLAREQEKGLWSTSLILLSKEKLKKEENLEPEYYIGNRNSKIFHRPSCSSIDMMNEENKIIFNRKEEALEAKFIPCKRCKP